MQEKHANHNNKKIVYTRKNNKLKTSLRYMYITRSMLLYRKYSFISASILKKKN